MAKLRYYNALEYLEQLGEVFGELAVQARLDTKAIRALGTIGHCNLTGPRALRRIAPGSEPAKHGLYGVALEQPLVT